MLQYAIAIGNTLCGGGGWRRDLESVNSCGLFENWSLGTIGHNECWWSFFFENSYFENSLLGFFEVILDLVGGGSWLG